MSIERRPRGLLLDFGGVVAIATTRSGWEHRLAATIDEMLRHDGLGDALGTDRIAADIAAGALADSRWKDAMSRPAAPSELTYEQFWLDFVAADWPEPEVRWLGSRARELCRTMGELRQTRTLRTGITELLGTAAQQDIPVGIVSNALMGDVHRTFLHSVGLGGAFRAQVYSDEVGVRKPNPELIRIGADSVGRSVEDCWYVGDNFDRDVLCGRRAGVGGVVLLEAPDTWDLPYEPIAVPDLTCASLDVLTGALADRRGVPC